MFTGIISDIGIVRRMLGSEDSLDSVVEIVTAYDLRSVKIGASISCSGVCLTVVSKGKDYFAVEVSEETLSKTTIGNWKESQKVNLERSLTLKDDFGGHIVAGHVDGVGEVKLVEPEGRSYRFEVGFPDELSGYIAKKGSIAIDGVSLTVNRVSDVDFSVNIIPYTKKVTTFGELKIADKVNLEVDILARYVERQLNRD